MYLLIFTSGCIGMWYMHDTSWSSELDIHTNTYNCGAHTHANNIHMWHVRGTLWTCTSLAYVCFTAILHIYIHTYIHTYVHTYIHTYSHAYKLHYEVMTLHIQIYMSHFEQYVYFICKNTHDSYSKAHSSIL